MRSHAAFLIVLASIAAMDLVHAQGWSGLLSDTPLSRFSDEDLSIFEAAVTEALESRPDGSSIPWENPNTGASGSVTPLKTERRDQRECRLLDIINRAEGRSGSARFWFAGTRMAYGTAFHPGSHP